MGYCTKINIKKSLMVFASPALLLICTVENAYAYIGPGAGFALVTSFSVIFVSIIIALISLLIWPIRQAKWMIMRKKPEGQASTEKVVVLGLDGLDPDLAES